jgi:hypothetical protein
LRVWHFPMAFVYFLPLIAFARRCPFARASRGVQGRAKGTSFALLLQPLEPLGHRFLVAVANLALALSWTNLAKEKPDEWKREGHVSNLLDDRKKNTDLAPPILRNQYTPFMARNGPEAGPQREGTIEREYTVKLDACLSDAELALPRRCNGRAFQAARPNHPPLLPSPSFSTLPPPPRGLPPPLHSTSPSNTN